MQMYLYLINIFITSCFKSLHNCFTLEASILSLTQDVYDVVLVY